MINFERGNTINNFIFIYAVPAVIIAIIFLIGSHIRTSKNLERNLRECFGKPPEKQEYSLDSIETYHVYKSSNSDTSKHIDDITWNDLDMDKVFRRINVCNTSIGEEYLYDCLHEPQFEQVRFSIREAFISRLQEQPEERLKVQMCLARLGKINFNGISDLIYNSGNQTLKFPFIYNILSIIPFLCVIFIIINMYAGIICLVASFAINMAVYFKMKRKIESAFTAIQYCLSMIFCCGKLLKIESLKSESFLMQLQKPFEIFKSLKRKGLEPRQKVFNESGIIMEYLRILLLSDVKNYNKIISSIYKNKEHFHNLYKILGEIDLAICVFSFRESLPFYSTPVFHDENCMNFKEIYHPLLSTPVPNSGIIKKNSIITGSNASGKSTFIKTLAINGILAQTVFTCTAETFFARFSLVMTSMALRDDITEGESYFITEIKSLKRILDKIADVHCVCYIDEILRGTNTIERIAASASILNYLNVKDCLCIIASHDIELAQMFRDIVDNYHFREQMTNNGMIFDYKINTGISNTRNAIKLLRYMNFDNTIVENAEKLANK